MLRAHDSDKRKGFLKPQIFADVVCERPLTMFVCVNAVLGTSLFNFQFSGFPLPSEIIAGEGACLHACNDAGENRAWLGSDGRRA